ncbi:arylsulfatase-1 [Coleophoma cylindrospora]|uniref:Arylsulfatase n=1 Tax=Coleophoma cylindrospora TaxID=1849047 RepID=A0A3D8S8L4_9HELO|nr:arylsulfatase-1 [Coleophoma cylindrospora]
MKLLGTALALAALTSAVDHQHALKQGDSRPNIIVILTDDQDLHMQSVEYMPLLKKHMIDQGTYYKKHYCTTAICCPSRVTLWTGKNAHNTNVTDVHPPYGGFPKFVSEGLNKNYLPVWLQEAGYSTFYTGKLFNAHNVQNWNSPHPAGWTSSDFLLDPFTYEYLNATFQRNQDEPVSHEGEYSTDVLAQKAFGLLEEAVDLGKPFFLTMAPIAPHSNVAAQQFPEPRSTPFTAAELMQVKMTTPIPAQRHKDLFPGAKVPRTANFNPDKPSGVSWLKHLDQLSAEAVQYNDDYYRARLQALQAVDEMVDELFERLASYGLLENTYVIYTSDNGFHISQHRLPPGKECGFEEDINIPLIIRGPSIPVGGETDIVTAHTDIVPTIFKLAGIKPREDFDGSAIPLNKTGLQQAIGERQEHVNVEYWGNALPEGKHWFSLDDGKPVFYVNNNTYKALRLIGKDYNLFYSVWCTNEHELYDMVTDPYQINNIYHSAPTEPERTILNLPLSKVLPRLDALLMVTKSCKGATCVNPWSVLHPQGDVKSLGDALNTNFDAFYMLDVKEKVSFDKCELGYIVESEGPQALGLPVFGQHKEDL